MLPEPSDLKIPTVEDFYYDGEVDERWAIDHYLGRDIDFTENRYYTLLPLEMLYDFHLVGARAFRYYVFGAFRYLQDVRSAGEPDVYAALPEILSRKIAEEPPAFTPVKDYLLRFCDWAFASHEKFNACQGIYGDVPSAYQTLAQEIRIKVPP